MFTESKLSPKTANLLVESCIINELDCAFFKMQNAFVVSIIGNNKQDLAELLEEKMNRFYAYQATRPHFTDKYWEKLTDKLTKEHLDSLVESAEYTHFANKASVCKITLQGGFCLYGTSGVLNAANFKQELGEKYAYENAFNQIWELEGFVFQEVLYYRENLAN